MGSEEKERKIVTWLEAKINDDPKKHVLRTQRWRRWNKEWKNILGTLRKRGRPRVSLLKKS
jgi:hypothetical protein